MLETGNVAVEPVEFNPKFCHGELHQAPRDRFPYTS